MPYDRSCSALLYFHHSHRHFRLFPAVSGTEKKSCRYQSVYQGKNGNPVSGPDSAVQCLWFSAPVSGHCPGYCQHRLDLCGGKCSGGCACLCPHGHGAGLSGQRRAKGKHHFFCSDCRGHLLDRYHIYGWDHDHLRICIYRSHDRAESAACSGCCGFFRTEPPEPHGSQPKESDRRLFSDL